MRFLVGCPVSEVYERYMSRWIDCVESFYLPKGWSVTTVMADTSEDMEFMSRWEDKVIMRFANVGKEPPTRRVAYGMETLRREFIGGGYDFYLNLEIDIVAPPETLITTWRLLEACGLDVVFMDYPCKGGFGSMIGVGCALFTRRSVDGIKFSDSPIALYPDTWYWNDVVVRSNLVTAKFHNALELGHGDETDLLLGGNNRSQLLANGWRRAEGQLEFYNCGRAGWGYGGKPA